MLISARALEESDRVLHAYRDWKAAHPAAHAEQFIQEVYDGPWTLGSLDWPTLVGFIQARLATAGTPAPSYNRKARYSNRVNVPSRVEDHTKFWLALERIGLLSAVVTTNYDLFVERSLRDRPMQRPRLPGFHYGGFARPQVLRGQAQPFSVKSPNREIELTGRVPLLKLHGSLNWSVESGCLVMYQDCRAAFRKAPIAAIVPPIPEKNEPEWLRETWDAARAALTNADAWVVCGYSLPEYDAAVRGLLVNAFGGQRIVVLDPGGATLAKAYAALLAARDVVPLDGLPGGLAQLDAALTR